MFVGLKVTVIEQVVFDTMVARQVLASVKLWGAAPVMAKLMIPRVVQPTLVSVTDFAAVPEFIFTVPKLRLLALNAGTGLLHRGLVRPQWAIRGEFQMLPMFFWAVMAARERRGSADCHPVVR
jgi:hypothetical protein